MIRLGSSRGLFNSRLAMLVVLLVAGLGVYSCAGEAEQTDGVRVVLFTLDTTRADALLTAGGPPPLEHVRERARQGLIFERLYAATGLTQPSHATMLTGMHPWRHGIFQNGSTLPERIETLAERLQSAGFRTGAAVASFPLENRFGFAQGFDMYLDELVSGPLKTGRGFSPAEFVAGEANRVLDELGGDKQFLWFHFFDAHMPYGLNTRPPNERMRPWDMRVAITDQGADRDEVLRQARRLYDEDIRIMDGYVDGLLRRLDDESSEFETHVVIVADHGENFGEAGLLAHGARLTQWDLQVPLVILSPDVEAGVRTEPVGMIDVPATLLELAGVATDIGSSRSLLEPSPRRQVMGMQRPFLEPNREIRLDGSVHIVEGLRFFSVIDGSLYMGNSQEVVLEDPNPGELEAERVAELKDLFRKLEDEMVDPETSPMDDEVIEQMKALGYIQ